jgi:Protein of unknown function (DUF2934)
MSSQRARITARAYDLWVQRGKPIGSPEVDWYEAQTQIENEANDPGKPKAALDPLAEEAADALTTGLDRVNRPGRSAGDPSATETTSPDGPIPKRSRAGRRSGRPASDNGAGRE